MSQFVCGVYSCTDDTFLTHQAQLFSFEYVFSTSNNSFKIVFCGFAVSFYGLPKL